MIGMTMARRGALSVVLGAAIWGLFWIPLRYLDRLGVHGLWAVAFVMLAATVPAVVLTVWRGETPYLRVRRSWSIGCALGVSTVLYFTGVLFSDVIRVIFLFYLLPVWTTLAARVSYGEPIQRAQLWVIALALVGVWLLLGGGANMPVPRNVGDWCGLGAGICWGVSLAHLSGEDEVGPCASAATALGTGGAAAVLLALLLAYIVPVTSLSIPDTVHLLSATPIALLFGILVLFPAMLSQIWGARLLPAPTAALLTMAEILVATVSAYLLVGTELTPISWLGAGVIMLAVVVDLRARFRLENV